MVPGSVFLMQVFFPFMFFKDLRTQKHNSQKTRTFRHSMVLESQSKIFVFGVISHFCRIIFFRILDSYAGVHTDGLRWFDVNCVGKQRTIKVHNSTSKAFKCLFVRLRCCNYVNVCAPKLSTWKDTSVVVLLKKRINLFGFGKFKNFCSVSKILFGFFR